MILCGQFKTVRGLEHAPRIDYMEFSFPSNNDMMKNFIPDDLYDEEGDVWLTVFWNESDWDYDKETGICSFTCSGVTINDINADGAIEVFDNTYVTEIQLFVNGKYNSNIGVEFLSLSLFDSDEFMTFEKHFNKTDINMFYLIVEGE